MRPLSITSPAPATPVAPFTSPAPATPAAPFVREPRG